MTNVSSVGMIQDTCACAYIPRGKNIPPTLGSHAVWDHRDVYQAAQQDIH